MMVLMVMMVVVMMLVMTVAMMMVAMMVMMAVVMMMVAIVLFPCFISFFLMEGHRSVTLPISPLMVLMVMMVVVRLVVARVGMMFFLSRRQTLQYPGRQARKKARHHCDASTATHHRQTVCPTGNSMAHTLSAGPEGGPSKTWI